MGNDLFRKSAKAFSIRVTGSLLAFSLSIVMARLLSPKDMGVYFMALMILTVLSVISRVGLDNTLLKSIAEHAELGRFEQIQAVFNDGFLAVVVIGGLITLLTYASSPLIAGLVFHNDAITNDIRIMSIGVVPFALIALTAASLKGLRLIGRAQVVESVVLPMLTLVVLLTFYILSASPSLHVVEIIYVSALFASVIISASIWRWSTGGFFVLGRLERKIRLIKESTPLLLVGILNLMMAWLATFLLGVMATSGDVAVYNIGVRVSMLASFVLTAVNNASSAKFAALYKAGDTNALEKIAFQSTCIVAAFSAPLIFIFVFFPNTIISLYGGAYHQAAPVLAILAIGQLFTVLTGSIGQLLIMSGHANELRKSVMVGVVSQFVIATILIPLYGALGAAVAEALCSLAINIRAAFFVRQKLHIKTTLLGI